jgi:integrase/recombinase XerD
MKTERKSRKLPGYLNDTEFNTIIKLVRKPYHKLAFMLAYHSGLRISEVVNLKPEDLDIPGKRIFIKEAKYGRDRVVPMPKGIPKSYTDLIPIKCGVRALQLAFKAYYVKSGVTKRDIHFHSLRHSFAVRAMEKGMPANQLQVLLGHENLSTTSIYTKVNPKDALDNYEKLW